jgi:hypothetical protein
MNYYITYFEIAAFLASLAAWRVIRTSKYLRLFPLLLFVIVSVEIYETFFKPAAHSVNALIYNYQVPLQYAIYLIILYYTLDRSRWRKFILPLLAVFVVITILSGIFLTPDDHFNVLSYCFGSVAIITGIMIKFYEMLKNPTEFDFLRKPFFYMLFAFLLFNVGTLPYFAMANWLYFVKGYKDTVIILANVMSVLNYILYSTYTIAFLWMIRKKAYS